MVNNIKCYIRYTNDYILIFIPDLYYSKKYNLRKYNEKYLYKKIINKSKKYNTDILNIYSNRMILECDNIYDPLINISHTIVDDLFIKTYIYRYKMAKIDIILNQIK